MKLVIQIPCLNEEGTLPATLADLPRGIPGVDVIETLVVDDGSTDRTREVAATHGVTRVVGFPVRRGLARAFSAGLLEALGMGADVIVNTDADNQYCGADIPRLIAPILEGRADMVVGDRQVDTVADFSPLKKWLQKLGSGVVRALAQADVPDATSGFRAYSREAALRLTVISDFTYTLETVIQASQKGLHITSVPIRTNPKTRESRLFTGMLSYIRRSMGTMLRLYVVYQPLRFFLTAAVVFLVPALILFARFLWFYFTLGGGVQTGHVQSLLIASVLAMIGFLLFVLGVLADLTAANRRLMEGILLDTRILRMREARREDGEHP